MTTPLATEYQDCEYDDDASGYDFVYVDCDYYDDYGYD